MSENIDKTGIIKISETAEKYVQAESAKLHLQITGENFFYGNAAREKSVEVKSLVEDLDKIVIGGEDILVKDVSLQTETGIFNKSSKGVYRLVVRVKDLTLMAEALGAIASQKNCQLIFTEWIFSEDAARFELAREALIKAKRKADLMAEAVGYKITGIKNCSDTYNELKTPLTLAEGFRVAKLKTDPAAGAADIGTQFQNENKVSAQVIVEFFIERSAQN